jgi:hypothetical protein
MSFYNGLLNLTNWAGNVIMPTLGALFIAFAVVQFARGYHHLYSTWAYGGLMCLMVSGLLRMFEKFTGQLRWNNPDLYWNSLLNMVDWFANVILPVYAGMHVTVGALKIRRAVRASGPSPVQSHAAFSGSHPVPDGLWAAAVRRILRRKRHGRL